MTEPESRTASELRMTELARRGPRKKPSFRRWLRFSLRTLLLTVTVICVVLAAAYYHLIRQLPRGPTIRLHANGTASVDRRLGLPWIGPDLAKILDEAAIRYGTVDDQGRSDATMVPWIGDRTAVLQVTIVADPEVPHGVLAALLRACVEKGFHQFLLKDASNRNRSIFFYLAPQLSCEGLSYCCGLPPVMVRLEAAQDGRLAGVRLIDKPLRNLSSLCDELVRLVGDDCVPRSVRATVEVQFDCDSNLQLCHVFEAKDTVASHVTEDGRSRTLVERVLPLRWLRWGDEP
jgi:hypothetical protein